MRWIYADETRRPFVMLSNGDRVLLDTGSSLGFAIRQQLAHSFGIPGIEQSGGRAITDVSGGTIEYRKAQPVTINIGSLELKNLPTEIIYGAASDSPLILGREALRPFYVAFDPVHRLILLAPSSG